MNPYSVGAAPSGSEVAAIGGRLAEVSTALAILAFASLVGTFVYGLYSVAHTSGAREPDELFLAGYGAWAILSGIGFLVGVTALMRRANRRGLATIGVVVNGLFGMTAFVFYFI